MNSILNSLIPQLKDIIYLIFVFKEHFHIQWINKNFHPLKEVIFFKYEAIMKKNKTVFIAFFRKLFIKLLINTFHTLTLLYYGVLFKTL